MGALDLSSSVIRIKILTSLLGLVSTILGFVSYAKHYDRDAFFVGTVTFCTIVSILSLLGSGFVNDNKNVKLTDMFYHGIGGLILFIAGCVYIASTVEAQNELDKFSSHGIKFSLNYYNERTAAAVIALFMGIFYGIVVFCVRKCNVTTQLNSAS